MLKTFFVPRGRMSRLRFWFAAAIIFIIYQAVELALLLLGTGLVPMRPALLETMLAGPLAVAIWCAAVVGLQRLHDRDRSGWWLLLALVPIGGGIWYVFANGTMPGTNGPNRFGEAPDRPDGAIAAVFDDKAIGDRPIDGAAVSGGRSRTGLLVGTIVLWIILLAETGVMALLFQDPGRRATRDSAALSWDDIPPQEPKREGLVLRTNSPIRTSSHDLESDPSRRAALVHSALDKAFFHAKPFARSCRAAVA